MIDPKTFVQQRFSPLFAIIVDEDVNKIMKPSKLTFFELFSALAYKESIRIVPMEEVKQTTFDNFFIKVQQKTSLYSKSFISPAYEANNTTDPIFSPFSGTINSTMPYPSKETINPPWYQFVFTTLNKFEQFSNFNFCDQPLCLLYVTPSGKPCITEKVLRSSLVFPEWMVEFVENIPIFNIIVYNGLEQKPATKSNQNEFFDVFYLPFGTRAEGTPGGVDPVDFRNLFRNDNSILSRPEVGSMMTEADLSNFRQVITDIFGRVQTTLSLQIQQLENQNNNNKQIKSKLNRLLHKSKSNDRKTRVLNVPFRKIIRLQLGCYYLIMRRYKESRKVLKQFIKTVKELFPELRLYTQYLRGMAAQQMPDREKKFKDDMNSILNTTIPVNNLIFYLYLPLMLGEMRLKQANFASAIQIYRDVIKKFIFKIPSQYQPLMAALVEERIAGIYMSENHLRMSLLYTSIASSNYLVSEQTNHSFRCLIWMISALPRDSWQYLYQNAMLMKAEICLSLSQASRSLQVYQTLLSLPDLVRILQKQVITEFWAPFNEPRDSNELIKLNSLLEVKKLSLVDNSNPEYWNIKKSEYNEFIFIFDKFMKKDQRVNYTMAQWFDEKSNNQVDKPENFVVSVGNPVYITIDLYNRFAFSINLSKANFAIEYNGVTSTETKTADYSLEPLGKIEDINALSTSKLPFKFIPFNEGQYTISKFIKNYWGSAETEVDCGPLTFIAKNDNPLLSIQFEDLPNNLPEFGINRFNVIVKNTSSSNVINNFYLVHDRNDLIISENKDIATIYESLTILNIKEQLIPGQNTSIPLLFRGVSPTLETIHFMAAINEKQILTYAVKKVQVVSRVEITANIVEKKNDVGNNIVYCSIKGNVNGICVKGIINRNCKFIRSIKCQQKHLKTLNAGQSCSMVAFASEETDVDAESWRNSFFSHVDNSESLALLFQFPESRILAQAPIKFIPKSQDYKLKIELPPIAKASIRLKSVCKVKLINPPQGSLIDFNDGNDENAFQLFIRPGKIMPGETEANDDHSFEDVAGCRWVGTTTTKLCRSNDYTAEFSFVAFRLGIFHVTGFVVSEDPSFAKAKEIKMLQSFRVYSV